MSVATAVRDADAVTTTKSFLLARADKMAPLLPEVWKHERVVELVVTAMAKNERLRQCSPESIYLALRESAAVGLEPCSPLQEAALVPYWNSKLQCLEAQFQPQYRGLVSAAKRTKEIIDVSAFVVYRGDEIDVDYGRDDMIHHKPLLTRSHNDMVAAWTRVRLASGFTHYEIMLAKDILPIKSRAMQRGKSEYSGPWISDEGEMWRKTVVKRAMKLCQPTQGQFAEALAKIIAADNRAEAGDDDGPVISVDAAPGKVVEDAPADPAKQTPTGEAAAAKVEAAQKRTRKPKDSKESQAPADAAASTAPPQEGTPEPTRAPASSDDINYKCKKCNMVTVDPTKCSGCGNTSFSAISSKDGSPKKDDGPPKEALKDAKPPEETKEAPKASKKPLFEEEKAPPPKAESDLVTALRKLNEGTATMDIKQLRQNLEESYETMKAANAEPSFFEALRACGVVDGDGKAAVSELKKCGNVKLRELIAECLKTVEGE